jgi:MYXO-CTERM domain-containing protein
VILVALLLPFSPCARADISALTSFSGGELATSGDDQLYGWIFSVNSPITVTALGVYNSTGTGLSISHDVGIFLQSNESLVDSVTVPSGTTGALINGFRYQAVTPFSLTAGDTYVIAMTMPAFNGDQQLINNTSVTTASQISYITSAFDKSSSLAFPDPTENGAFAIGMFGPNFTFTSVSATPEPSFYVILGLALAGLLLFASRRRV